MTQNMWLLSPLVTSVFFVLGIVLFFQVIMRMMALSYAKTNWSIATFERIQKIVSLIYFGMMAVMIEIVDFRYAGHNGFVNFRILLVIYIAVYLGRREGMTVAIISWITFAVLRGVSMVTLAFLGSLIVGYGVVALLVELLHHEKISMLTWTISLNVAVAGYWFWLTGGSLQNSEMWYQIFAFILTSCCLSFELTQIAADNDQIITITRQARIDYLTGLKNHEVFTKEYEVAFNSAIEANQPLRLMALDIDHFKSINDTYGHLAGNKILSFVGKTFYEIVGDLPNVDCYRVGGEEFDIIFVNTDMSDIEEIAREIKQRIAMTEIHYKEHLIKITISIGIATKRPDENADELYDRADHMLYSSKQNGRNQITVDNELKSI